MPCEGCTVQFTVFRRKRCCSDCKRFFCSNCLVPASPTRGIVGPLCERCAVFAKRPLLRVDLLQLKPKDLIFYLQSKHISTAGCVEKDELVGLVLNHIQQADQTYATSNSSNRFSSGNASRGVDSTTHSFDTLKQTCQNFFSNISDKVDSFAFEAKPTQDKPQTESSCRSTPSNSLNSHISEQPRVSTRVIPTYASFQHCHTQPSTEEFTSEQRSHPQSPIASSSSNTSPSVRNNSIRIPRCSPVVSLESSSPLELAGTEASANVLVVEHDPSPYTVDSNRCDDRHLNGSASGCDCSDDEIINTFRGRAVGSRSSDRQNSLQSSPSIENPVAGPSGSSNVLTSTSSVTKKSSPSLKIESYDESSESSFEELGAVGGTSDDSKTAADISVQTSEQWQFIEKASEKLSAANTDSGNGKENVLENVGVGPLTVAVRSDQTQLQRSLQIAMRPKKVARRRSDGYLNRRRPRSDDDDSPTSPDHFRPLVNCSNARSLLEEDEADNENCDNGSNGREVEMGKDVVLLVHDNRLSCRRCGKNRTNIKKHVEKMRRHLENSQMPESDIKQELEDFLVYLENRTKSLDCSDSDATVASSLSGVRDGTNRQMPPVLYDENEGIHVYAAPPSFNAAMTNSRFIILEDFDSLEKLENLSVKQLKEVLMLNRVDYKGCCEKQELFDRVARLWKNLKSTPTVEKLQTDELCKICMDAPIECVILECGHMATCTNCGKVLSECPICRQYIVRVVRFFKA